MNTSELWDFASSEWMNNIVYIDVYRHKKCVQKLVEAGADISVHDNEGLTAVSDIRM